MADDERERDDAIDAALLRRTGRGLAVWHRRLIWAGGLGLAAMVIGLVVVVRSDAAEWSVPAKIVMVSLVVLAILPGVVMAGARVSLEHQFERGNEVRLRLAPIVGGILGLVALPFLLVVFS